MDKRNDLGINLIGYATGYSAGASGGGGGVTNDAVSFTGTGSNAFWTINWKDLVIPDTLTSIEGIFANLKSSNIPKLIFNDNITSVASACYGYKGNNADLSGWNITNVNNFSYAFASGHLTSYNFSKHCTASDVSCKNMFNYYGEHIALDLSSLYIDNLKTGEAMFSYASVTSVDIRNIKNTTGATYKNMFTGCTGLTHIDIRGLTFEGNTSTGMLTSVPTTCEIIVKDDNEKTIFSGRFQSYTNVKTVAEYEG